MIALLLVGCALFTPGDCLLCGIFAPNAPCDQCNLASEDSGLDTDADPLGDFGGVYSTNLCKMMIRCATYEDADDLIRYDLESQSQCEKQVASEVALNCTELASGCAAACTKAMKRINRAESCDAWRTGSFPEACSRVCPSESVLAQCEG